MQIKVVVFSFLLLSVVSNAYSWQILSVVDMPTAGMKTRGFYSLDTRVYSPNGIVAGFDVGVFSRLMVGVSYGGTNIIGSDRVDWNGSKVGLSARIRIIEEKLHFPALAIGFNSQGYGKIVRDTVFNYDRFLFRSHGLYMVTSKGFNVGQLATAIHASVNHSFERANLGDAPFWENLDPWAGFDISYRNFMIATEYSPAFGERGVNGRDEDDRSIFRGYINSAVKWHITSNFLIGFHIKDILGINVDNGFASERGERELNFVYVNSF